MPVPITPAAIEPPITDALLDDLRRAFHNPMAPLPLTLAGDTVITSVAAALDELARFRELLGRQYCDEVKQAIAIRATSNVITLPVRRL